jgi:hypothetical protein
MTEPQSDIKLSGGTVDKRRAEILCFYRYLHKRRTLTIKSVKTPLTNTLIIGKYVLATQCNTTEQVSVGRRISVRISAGSSAILFWS